MSLSPDSDDLLVFIRHYISILLLCLVYSRSRPGGGGGVSKEDVGSIITASMTSRFALVVFKMAGEVAIVGRSTNVAFSSLTSLHLLKSKMQRQLGR